MKLQHGRGPVHVIVIAFNSPEGVACHKKAWGPKIRSKTIHSASGLHTLSHNTKGGTYINLFPKPLNRTSCEKEREKVIDGIYTIHRRSAFGRTPPLMDAAVIHGICTHGFCTGATRFFSDACFALRAPRGRPTSPVPGDRNRGGTLYLRLSFITTPRQSRFRRRLPLCVAGRPEVSGTRRIPSPA